ncbi:hypothetical protein RJ640_013332 [Escallonia rubra]|uniref:Acyltransferase n=1 Tax=Escallonia rubra TaxID=112253 RepID=A0AA88UBZ7_9ASTE|nr:hypothetical protein RJ640_013332 [Escallonia rubra]
MLVEVMALVVKNFWVSSYSGLNSVHKPQSRVQVRSLAGGNSDLGRENEVPAFGKKEDRKDAVSKKLEPSWDDRCGTDIVTDYLDTSKEMIKPDGIDGLGLGFILYHKALGRIFEIRCLHIPIQDRTPFQGLDFLLLQDVTFATSFGRSQLQPLLPVLEALPDERHVAVPYLLGLLMVFSLFLLRELADNIPKDTLRWKLKLLKSAAAYAISRLHAVTAELYGPVQVDLVASYFCNGILVYLWPVMLLRNSGRDYLLSGEDEAQRLSRSLQNCNICYFKDYGQAILLEDSFNLLTVIKGTCKYCCSRKHDFVMDFVPPSISECEQALEAHRWYLFAISPIMLSTLEDGKIMRGLAGIPNKGPVLLVGNHMLLGREIIPLVSEFIRENNVLVRGLAHPAFLKAGQSNEFSHYDFVKACGALPVTASNFFKLPATNSYALLYPGGLRESFHHKGEEYKLFWPEKPEFVRMAAKFGATIVPFGVVGEDDLAEQLVLDFNGMLTLPGLNDDIRRMNEEIRQFSELGERIYQEIHSPGLLPKIPGRLYFLFGKPIQTKGRAEILKDRECAKELYLQIKTEVERNIAYLIKKREEDPYRGIIQRTMYRAFAAPLEGVPALEP